MKLATFFFTLFIGLHYLSCGKQPNDEGSILDEKTASFIPGKTLTMELGPYAVRFLPNTFSEQQTITITNRNDTSDIAENFDKELGIYNTAHMAKHAVPLDGETGTYSVINREAVSADHLAIQIGDGSAPVIQDNIHGIIVCSKTGDEIFENNGPTHKVFHDALRIQGYDDNCNYIYRMEVNDSKNINLAGIFDSTVLGKIQWKTIIKTIVKVVEKDILHVDQSNIDLALKQIATVLEGAQSVEERLIHTGAGIVSQGCHELMAFVLRKICTKILVKSEQLIIGAISAAIGEALDISQSYAGAAISSTLNFVILTTLEFADGKVCAALEEQIDDRVENLCSLFATNLETVVDIVIEELNKDVIKFVSGGLLKNKS